jgi:putative endonuclease
MRKEKYYFVYISTNKAHRVLYTGVTGNLFERDDQHKKKINKNSFTAKYNVNKIVYYETFTDVHAAIAREKEIKGWRREKKLRLIRKDNPGWKDLVEESWK